MDTALSTGLFKKLTKFPYLLPDAALIPSFAAGANPTLVFSYADLAGSGLLLRARDLQAASVAGVTLRPHADEFQPRPIDSAAIAALDPFRDAWRETSNLVAASLLQLNVANGTGATQDNYWANWGVEVWKPNVAQKLQLPGTFALDSAEQALAQSHGLNPPTPRGVLPRTLDWIMANEYANQILDAVPVAQTLAVPGTGAPVLVGQVNAAANEALVIAGFATSQGSGADGLTVWLGVDTDDSFLQIPAYPAGGGKPMLTFIQCASQAKIQASATSAVAAASIAAVVWKVRLTDEIAARIGKPASAQVVAKESAGVL